MGRILFDLVFGYIPAREQADEEKESKATEPKPSS